MLFFCVFKSPAEGRTHIFRPGEPFAQIIVSRCVVNLPIETLRSIQVSVKRRAAMKSAPG
jgi:hypothetical protein